MIKSRIRILGAIAFTGFMTCAPTFAASAKPEEFQCGGAVEIEVWSLWDSSVSALVSGEMIEKQLLQRGDTYALYNFQTYVHNLAAMAARCERWTRVSEIAQMMDKAYSGLSTVPGEPGKRWICRGGGVCNATNKLINTEVMLVSVQFLGMAAQVANAIALRSTAPEGTDLRFVRTTVEVSVEHLLRWGRLIADSVKTKLKATAADVKGGDASLFFSDKELWMLGIFSDVAGILNSEFGKRNLSGVLEGKSREDFNRTANALFRLLTLRVSVEKIPGRDGKELVVADLDKGYEGQYRDNGYAGYSGEVKPVSCETVGKGVTKPKIHVQKEDVPFVKELGWDFSHARRLVHVLHSLSRNREAATQQLSVAADHMPPAGLTEAFANRVVTSIWNGSRDYPLFANFWNGANGWYRVAYDNGTGNCVEGTPPFGLSDSFATGGFISWGGKVPALSELGARLHDLFASEEPEAVRFVESRYPKFGKKAPRNERLVSQVMFLPSLVAARPASGGPSH